MSTQEKLARALLDLIEMNSYDAITIQDITDRAGVGRTTFYLHFKTKDDLFIHAHTVEITRLVGETLTEEALFSNEVPPAMLALFEHHWQQRKLLRHVFMSKDGDLIQLHLTEHLVTQVSAALQQQTSTMSVEVLANYLVGSQLALMRWWLSQQPSRYTPEEMAAIYFRLQQAVIKEAFTTD